MLYWYKVERILLRRCNFYYVISIVCFERKSIHICFSPKKGRSDTTLYLEYDITFYRYMKPIVY